MIYQLDEKVEVEVVRWMVVGSHWMDGEAIRMVRHLTVWKQIWREEKEKAIISESPCLLSSRQLQRIALLKMESLILSTSQGGTKKTPQLRERATYLGPLVYRITRAQILQWLTWYDRPFYAYPQGIRSIEDLFPFSLVPPIAFPSFPSSPVPLTNPLIDRSTPNQLYYQLQVPSPSLLAWTELDASLLAHLWAYRLAVAEEMDSAVILDPGMILPENFDDQYEQVIDEFESQVVLLAPYVYSWEGAKDLMIEDEEEIVTSKLCSLPETRPDGLFAYWITREWMERLLHKFDRVSSPPPTDLFAELVLATTSSMLKHPLCYRIDQPHFRSYYRYYYPSS